MAATPDAADPKLAAQGLSFTPPGTPPMPAPEVPAGELLQSGDAASPAPAMPAADTGSFAPPPMASEQDPETRA